MKRKKITKMWKVWNPENGNEQSENVYPWDIKNKIVEVKRLTERRLQNNLYKGKNIWKKDVLK